MQLHPATQILIWCMLVAAAQGLSLGALLAAAGFIVVCALLISANKLMQLVRRTRWIMLSLLLVYAYSTPGQPLMDMLGMFSPSREGLIDGALQLGRLLVALAGLAILLDRLHRLPLISGLYFLFVPLQWMGLSRERFAVRLALTLHYAEAAMLRGTHTWQNALHDLFELHSETTRKIELPLYRFGIADVLLLSITLSMLLVTLR